MTFKSVNPLRVAVLTNIIPRYRTPVFSRIADDPRFELSFFVSMPVERSDPQARERLDLRASRTFNMRWKTSTRSTGVDQVEPLPLPVGLPIDLIRFRPDVIVSGDMGVRSVIAWLMARLLRVPLVIWTEETLAHDAIVGGLQQRLRRFLLKRTTRFLAWGKAACMYLAERGVPPDRITYCSQAVDNDEWAYRALASDPDALIEQLGLKGRICLAVGRLLPLKGYKELVSAFASLPQHIREANSLVIVGEGPEQEALVAQVRGLGVENIFMVGSKSPEELAAYYRAADFLVLPSFTDVWGLVVNESMACGTPATTSVFSGVSTELVEDTGLGETFDPGDARAFVDVLSRWLVSAPEFDKNAPFEAVSRLNFNVSVEAISRVLQEYADKGGRS